MRVYRDRQCKRCSTTYTPTGPNCRYCPKCRTSPQPSAAKIRREAVRTMPPQAREALAGLTSAQLLSQARDSLVRAAWCFAAAGRDKTSASIMAFADRVVPG